MRVLASALMCAAFGSYAAEPYELKGDGLGMSLAEFRAKYQRVISGHGQPAPMCSDTSPSGLFVKLPVSGIGVIRCLQHYPFEERYDSLTRKSAPPTTIANVPARILYSFIAPDVEAKADAAYALYSIYGSFGSNEFARVRNAVIEKYGEPAQRDSVVLQNRMGATFTGEVLIWTRGDSAMRLAQYAGSTENASLSIVDVKKTAEYQERQKAKQGKQGAKDL